MPPASSHSAKHPAPRGDEAHTRTAPHIVLQLTRWLPVAVVVAAALLFTVLKLYSLNVVAGDEHLYFNMAVAVNKGLIPHRDFFYTHPPLHLYLAVMAFKLFGYSLALGKALTNGAMLIAGVLVFAIGRRALGASEAAVACAIFLLSFDPLRISSHFTGGNETFAFAMIGLWLAHLDRPLLAGVAFGLGALVAVYIAPGAAAVALMLWWRSRGAAIRFVVVAALVVLCGNLLLYAVAGWDFIYQVYVTQMQKGKEGNLIEYTLYHRLGYIMYENRMLTAGAVAGLVLLVMDVRSRLASGPTRRCLWQEPHAEALLLFVAWFGLYWIFYLSIATQHAYYFIFIMPVFAWLSAYAYGSVGRAIVSTVRPSRDVSTLTTQPSTRRRSTTAPGSSRLAPLLPAAVALVLTVANIGVVEALYVPYALKRNGTAVSRYTWKPLRHLRFLDANVQAAFWQAQYDPHHPPSGITRYLQHESQQITVAEQIYAAVRQYSAPDDTIFGEPDIVPLISSETGRRMAANLIDTSGYRISYGLSRIEDWIAAIDADHVRVLVVRQGVIPMGYPQFREYAQRNFQTVQRIRDPEEGVFEIMRRVER